MKPKVRHVHHEKREKRSIVIESRPKIDIELDIEKFERMETVYKGDEIPEEEIQELNKMLCDLVSVKK